MEEFFMKKKSVLKSCCRSGATLTSNEECAFVLRQVSPDLQKPQRGFTLIELLVVVLIIGILAAVALPQYQLSVEKARATEALVNLRAVHNALEVYWLANGVYPESFEEIDIEKPDNTHSQYSYNRGLFAGITMRSDKEGVRYSIVRMLEHGSGASSPFNAVCSLPDSVDSVSSLPAKLCKNLCKTSSLYVVWGSGQKGCLFNM